MVILLFEYLIAVQYCLTTELAPSLDEDEDEDR